MPFHTNDNKRHFVKLEKLGWFFSHFRLLTIEDDLLELLVIASLEDVLVEWTGGTCCLLVGVAPLDALGVQLNDIGRLHAQVEAAHAVLRTGDVFQNDVVASTPVTPTPGRNGVRLHGHLRVAHPRAALRARGLCLDQKGALPFDGKVACPGNCERKKRKGEN